MRKQLPDIAGWCERSGNIATPGMVIKFMRTSFGLSVEQVATCASVNPALLIEVEQDQRRAPSPAWLGAVADAIMHLYRQGGERG